MIIREFPSLNSLVINTFVILSEVKFVSDISILLEAPQCLQPHRLASMLAF